MKGGGYVPAEPILKPTSMRRRPDIRHCRRAACAFNLGPGATWARVRRSNRAQALPLRFPAPLPGEADLAKMTVIAGSPGSVSAHWPLAARQQNPTLRGREALIAPGPADCPPRRLIVPSARATM